MIRIDNDRCCCCGHCQFIRMTLPVVKSVNGVDYFEDPRPEDIPYIQKMVSECWTGALEMDPIPEPIED